MTDLAAAEIKSNIARVQDKIDTACSKVGRDPAAVRLVAVSKGKPVTDVLAAVEAGLQHFGENRVEESIVKIPAVHDQLDRQVTWHMVGHVQSRKARYIPHLFHILHSVDSLGLAQKLSRLLANSGETLDILIQMNVAGEEQKYGFAASQWQSDAAERDHLIHTVRQITQLPGLNLRGLMTMAHLVTDMEETRPVFAGMAALRSELEAALALQLPDLSMGMTDDYPVAIEEGATLVRVGRAIFGARNG